jgi:hypothetical protein
LNGSSLNGSSLNGSSLNGSSLNGDALIASRLEGTAFHADLPDGTRLAGRDFRGIRFTGYTWRGGRVPMRIDDIEPSSLQEDVLLYRVSYFARGEWNLLCGRDAEGRVLRAIPLAGAWNERGDRIYDARMMTWACQDGAVAKCVERVGYKPWLSQDHEARHQACTRMIRADYCGDGRSWTVNGRAINVYDSIGVQGDTEAWTFEAEWDQNGARCVSSRRVVKLARGRKLTPTCLAEKLLPDCGTPEHFRTGALLMSEYETQLRTHDGVRTRGDLAARIRAPRER